MSSSTKSVLNDQCSIMSMIHGMWQARCLSVLVGLKIPELLCNAREESLSIEEIAYLTGCTSTQHIYHVLRVLAHRAQIHDVTSMFNYSISHL